MISFTDRKIRQQIDLLMSVFLSLILGWFFKSVCCLERVGLTIQPSRKNCRYLILVRLFMPISMWVPAFMRICQLLVAGRERNRKQRKTNCFIIVTFPGIAQSC